jgi:transposase
MHTGCQWAELPIEKDAIGQPEIHYTRVYQKFGFWQNRGCFDNIFKNSVLTLHLNNMLNLDVIHGDGTTTAAKKGGDNLGYNGHKHMKGDKIIAFCDRNCNIISPFISAPGNKNESPLLKAALLPLKQFEKEIGFNLSDSIMSLDGGYDSKSNRKLIFNNKMTPNIPENKRNKKVTKRGRPRLFSKDVSKERLRKIERIFAWEDKFKRLLIRFERKSELHYAMKTIAFTMINFRHFA